MPHNHLVITPQLRGAGGLPAAPLDHRGLALALTPTPAPTRTATPTPAPPHPRLDPLGPPLACTPRPHPRQAVSERAAELGELRVSQLRERLVSAGESALGRKPELLKRLLLHDAAAAAAAEQGDDGRALQEGEGSAADGLEDDVARALQSQTIRAIAEKRVARVTTSSDAPPRPAFAEPGEEDDLLEEGEPLEPIGALPLPDPEEAPTDIDAHVHVHAHAHVHMRHAHACMSCLDVTGTCARLLRACCTCRSVCTRAGTAMVEHGMGKHRPARHSRGRRGHGRGGAAGTHARAQHRLQPCAPPSLQPCNPATMQPRNLAHPGTDGRAQ